MKQEIEKYLGLLLSELGLNEIYKIIVNANYELNFYNIELHFNNTFISKVISFNQCVDKYIKHIFKDMLFTIQSNIINNL